MDRNIERARKAVSREIARAILQKGIVRPGDYESIAGEASRHLPGKDRVDGTTVGDFVTRTHIRESRRLDDEERGRLLDLSQAWLEDFDFNDLEQTLGRCCEIIMKTPHGKLFAASGYWDSMTVTNEIRGTMETAEGYDSRFFDGNWWANQVCAVNLSDLARPMPDDTRPVIRTLCETIQNSPIAAFAVREWISAVESVLEPKERDPEADSPIPEDMRLADKVEELLGRFNGDIAVQMDDAFDPLEYGAHLVREKDGSFTLSECLYGDRQWMEGAKVTVRDLDDAAADAFRKACGVIPDDDRPSFGPAA